MASLLRPLLRRGKPLTVGIRRYTTPNFRPRNPGLTAFVAGICGIAVGLGVAQVLPRKSTQVQSTLPTYGTAKEFSQAIEDLRNTFSTRAGVVSTDPDDLKLHGLSTNTYHTGVDHSVVVYPESTEDVVKVVKVANKYKMPITPYSGATSLEGQFIGRPGGGICVDMSGMNKILAIHEADADVVCQPGLGWMELNETLQSQGIPLFFPIDPAPDATIGGMASTGCSGTNAVRYGTAKAEWFLNITVVLPSGEVIKTRRRSRKSSAGFDTTKLFIGAEGTLGIITEVTLRLAPLLPTTVASVQFPDVKAAVEASIQILRSGIAAGIQCVELVDDTFLAATNKYGASDHVYPESDGLFFKFQGHSPASLAETARVAQEICVRHGGTGFRLAQDAEEAHDIWQDRKNAHFVGMALVPGAKGWATDVCVPVSNLPELVLETKKDLARIGLPYTIVGHVGDGNFHALLLFTSDEELKVVKEAVHRMVERAIALDGTCTGEHGVGVGKREFLVEELGAGTVGLMKAIKRTVDPLGLFNPGKLYPDDEKEDGAGSAKGSS
ncbi:FAD-linked oxidase-like protein [Mycena metata]|uniref:D-lactate dehydrogenase (cytochrome) n=1 Tax=Mycena metata TaxID=1033252 RepID=A0AAD7IXA2_9AGAR|nr:FAD-linked oxidase-like protein [Mycena metata]KAJ7764428.1 FAD-linked oxidase-like protein [Mycena metata]